MRKPDTRLREEHKSPYEGYNKRIGKGKKYDYSYENAERKQEELERQRALLERGAISKDGLLDANKLNKGEVFLNFEGSHGTKHKIVYVAIVAYLLTFEDDLVLVDKIHAKVPSGYILMELVAGNSVADYVKAVSIIKSADIPLLSC